MLQSQVSNNLKRGLKIFTVILVVLSILVSSVFCAFEAFSASNTGTVKCYVAIDNGWKQIATITTSTHKNFDVDRWYVTTNQLEQVYSEYGFTNDGYDGSNIIFAHTTDGDIYQLWVDLSAQKDETNNTYIVPLESSEVSRVYYVPANTQTGNSLGVGAAAKSNSFYTVFCRDALNVLDSADIPADQYVFKGGSVNVELPLKDGVTYYAIEANANAESELSNCTQTTDETNNKVTLSITDISSPVFITNSKTVGIAEFYALVDNEWVDVGFLPLTNQKAYFSDIGETRNYVTAEQLVKIYGDPYGLKESDITASARIFANNDDYYQSSDYYHEWIWADVCPKTLTTTDSDGNSTTVTVQPVSKRLHSKIYYLPNNNSSAASYFTGKQSCNDSQLITDNSIYSITVTDTGNLVADDDKASLPEKQYVSSGSDKSLTLPALTDENGKYIIKNAQTGESVKATTTKNDDGTYTIDLTDIKCPVLITTKVVRLHVTYKPELTESMLVNKQGYPNDHVTIESQATVEGESEYTENVESTNYTLRSPSTEVLTTVGDGRNLGKRVFYTFSGWKLGDSSTVYKAGEEINQNTLLAYADEEGNVDITPIWNAYDEKDRFATCNFFVNLNCEIMDINSNGYNGQPTSNFTSCVYSSRVLTTCTMPFTAYQDEQLTASDTADNAYDIDAQIRTVDKTEIEGVLLENFPTNEEVLAKIRASGATIKLDGVAIDSDDITSEKFTIRWYVLKYEHSDGYHIDGVLVAKKAKFVVKKTFVGDDEAIEEVKNNFYITVDQNTDTRETAAYKLSLNSAEQESDSEYTGYTSYDAETDTYIWELDARQSATYTIKEHNYSLNPDKWNNTSKYKIENSDAVTDSKWVTYTDDGIQLEAEAYGTDTPQSAIKTASLQNVYVRSGLLTVNKVDSSTYHGMKNIKFKLSREDGTALTLYKKADSNQYSTDTSAPNYGYTEVVEDNILETDANGFFDVRLAIYKTDETSAKYYLEEEIPVGYEGAKKILLTVKDDGTVTMAQEVVETTVDTSYIDDSEWLDGKDTATLTIKNKSKLLTKVKAQKDWGDDATDAEKLPVTVQLWKNGAKATGDAYTKILNADNNWTYEWENLPLYEDGEPVQYSLRETLIGSTAYDADADTDGYSEYVVTYDTTLYRIDEGDYTTNPSWIDATSKERVFANNALLVVHNRLLKGKIGFAKVDDAGKALQGAEFTLYSDEECTIALETATADNSGFVSFKTEQPQGTYYMKETKVPDNYYPNDTVYAVTVKRSKVVITAVGSDTEITQIVNEYKFKDLEFSFIKTDGEDNITPLGNAKFGLYKLICTTDGHDHSEELITVKSNGELADDYTACWELVTTCTSSSKTGLVKFSGLRGNETYRLVEYGTPAGYKSPAGQWAITYGLDDNNQRRFIITAVYKNNKKPPAFETVTDTTVTTASYRLRNYKLDDLPVSGSYGIYKYLAGGISLITVGGFLLLANKKRKDSAAKNNAE